MSSSIPTRELCLLNQRILPETLRSLVGDGSIKPRPFWRPLLPIIGRGKSGQNTTDRPPKRPFQNPLRLFLYPDVSILLFFNAVLYAVFYGVTASISTLFSETYPFLDETAIGLCFLAIGGGMLFGSWITGTVLDKEYQRVKRSLERKAREDPESKIKPEDVTKDENFPIEYARFRTMPFYFTVYVACCAGYGWCLQSKVNIAGPLILQIISEFLSIQRSTRTLTDDVSRVCYCDYDEHHTDAISRLTSQPRLFSDSMRTSSQLIVVPDFTNISAEQPRAMLIWSCLRLRHRPHDQGNGGRLDVRPARRSLRPCWPFNVRYHVRGPAI